jgi:hypothetical protein
VAVRHPARENDVRRAVPRHTEQESQSSRPSSRTTALRAALSGHAPVGHNAMPRS